MHSKKKCLKLLKKLLRKHTETWTLLYEAGFDDASAGKPMQDFPEADGDAMEMYAKLFGKALYMEGYRLGGEAVK